jgi:hypothetical protein
MSPVRTTRFGVKTFQGFGSIAKSLLGAAISLAACSGCVSQQSLQRPNGDMEYLISCDGGAPWSACYDKADKLCPTGYSPLSEDAGSKGKQLRITCPQRIVH